MSVVWFYLQDSYMQFCAVCSDRVWTVGQGFDSSQWPVVSNRFDFRHRRSLKKSSVIWCNEHMVFVRLEMSFIRHWIKSTRAFFFLRLLSLCSKLFKFMPIRYRANYANCAFAQIFSFAPWTTKAFSFACLCICVRVWTSELAYVAPVTTHE